MESAKLGAGREDVMAFRGEALPVGALFEGARTAPVHEPATGVGVRHTAVGPKLSAV